MTETVHFEIHIDGQLFKVEKSSMLGSELKALAGKDPSYQLFEEEPSNQPDRLIADTTAVMIRNGLHFYTVPPATFGAHG